MSIPTPSTGLDLERELSCSICTDILYQPLTLLDCLHTFCGSCLKEWFSWQAAAARQKRRQDGWPSTRYLYTCPSCRAIVRETRPNATVTTLLDMYLKANPEKGKSEDDRKEIAKHFKQGDSVLPKPSSPSPSARGRRHATEGDDEDDRRLIEEVRQMSLRELERRGTRSSRGEGERRRDERNRRRDQMLAPAPPVAVGESASTTPLRTERADLSRGQAQPEQRDIGSLGHQSSLRSMISSSDLQPQEEIMQQMLDEGLLDDIDFSNVDRNDEEEISELIAQAYRQRLRDRESSQEQRVQTGRTNRFRGDSPDLGTAPPSSYHRVAAGSPAGVRRGQRSSSQESGSSSRVVPRARHSSVEASRGLPRSSPVPSNRSETNAGQSRQQRRAASYDINSVDAQNTYPSTSDRTRTNATTASVADSSTLNNGIEQPAPDSLVEEARSSEQGQASAGTSADSNIQALAETSPASLAQRDGPGSEDSPLAVIAPFRYCSSCARSRIQHDIHYTCSICPPTTGSDIFALCRRCYQQSNGCLHWFGFGTGAWDRFRQKFPEGSKTEPPHVLMPERFCRLAGSESDGEGKCYHQAGVFCDSCGSHANPCYWRCNVCNQGDWGFCNTCVNQARHCTHPLLPLSIEIAQPEPSNQVSNSGKLTPIPVHTTCNICSNPIAPSNTRFHCTSCNDGDYDVCKSCYQGLVSSGNISPQNGPKGWRKCERGHRMLIVGFENRMEGQHRIVSENVIGGWQLAEEDEQNLISSADSAANPDEADSRDTSHWSWRDSKSGSWKHKARSQTQGFPDGSATTFSTQALRVPPPGGSGFRVTALWTRIPDDDVGDELAFPKWAEITEVLEINEDWCWGVYCRNRGLFPRAFGRAL